METIPQDVAEAVRVAADAARGYPGTLGDVRLRARRRRTRRVALAAAVATVLATAGLGAAVQGGAGPAPGGGGTDGGGEAHPETGDRGLPEPRFPSHTPR
jgi:hypothetical protein